MSTATITRASKKAPVSPVELHRTDAEADAALEGEPTPVGDRCGVCRGHGLVRGVGKHAGGHYRTTNGAQEALAAGRAKDCTACEGTGIATVAPF